MSFTLTVRSFVLDRTGRAFRRVVNDNRIDFQSWIEFFNDATHQQRMADAELEGRPALAGVNAELERHPAFAGLQTGGEPQDIDRRHQAIGVIVRLVMEGLGWEKAGKERGDMTGFSDVFKTAQRYRRVK